MSMVINLVEDHNIYLCEGGPVYNGGVQPTPITYLTQWKIVGNSEVHTLPYPDIPQGYTKCKYLEFHGTEYIDSGIIPEQGIGIDMQFSYSNTGESELIGVRTSAWSADSLYVFHQATSGKMFVSYGGKVCSTDAASPVINKDEIVTITLDSQKYKSVINGSTFEKNVETAIVKGTAPLFIGDVAGYGSSTFSGKLYYVKISLNGANIFNGIPCLDDNDVPCLYDTISGTSFYNDGTGTFGYEIEPQPTEIWSCGEYNATDGKYHILVQPQGGRIADIALDEPLRKVNDVADTIEFPSDTEGKALVTRFLSSVDLGNFTYTEYLTNAFASVTNLPGALNPLNDNSIFKGLIADFEIISANALYVGANNDTLSRNSISLKGTVRVFDPDYKGANPQDIKNRLNGVELIYELATPTTELVDVPQIEKADSYSCVISQDGKAVSWSSFITNSE